MQFTFIDSGRTIEIGGISFLTLSLLRSHYENTYGVKPVEPKDPLDTLEDGDVKSEAFKQASEKYQKDKEAYDAALVEWKNVVGKAQWAGTKLLYAKHLKAIDQAAVDHAVEDMQLIGMDLRQMVRDGYAELNVPMPEDLLDKYIYLFHVCITNQSEQTLFTNMIFSGSAPSQEAVREALFRLRG